MFITLYTDASYRHQANVAVLAWRGKCELGWVSGTMTIDCEDVHEAEMAAIRFAIDSALTKFPNLEGFFVNSDNLGCVRAFWTFGTWGVPGPAKAEHEKVLALVGEKRWIRTKHVKAHTGRKDVRSYMNRSVDRMTRA